jgi:predicted nucleic-acid-binding Zn-ribbon protein
MPRKDDSTDYIFMPHLDFAFEVDLKDFTTVWCNKCSEPLTYSEDTREWEHKDPNGCMIIDGEIRDANEDTLQLPSTCD